MVSWLVKDQPPSCLTTLVINSEAGWSIDQIYYSRITKDIILIQSKDYPFHRNKEHGHYGMTSWTLSVVATCSGKQTHSEGRCRQWSAVYDTGGPKAESPLSQGPRPAFVKILYTLCVRVWTHHSKFLETYINQGKYNPNNPIIHMLCSCAQTVKQLANNQ